MDSFPDPQTYADPRREISRKTVKRFVGSHKPKLNC